MPPYVKRTGRDVTDDILTRLGEIEETVNRLRFSPKRTAFDRGDTAAIADPFEGQVVIQYDTDEPFYYSNGVWRPFATTPPSPFVTQLEKFTSGTITVNAGSTGTFPLGRSSGDSFLDFSTSTNPLYGADGAYVIVCWFTSNTGSGSTFAATDKVTFTLTTDTTAGSFSVPDNRGAVEDTFNGHLALPVQAAATDGFSVTVKNDTVHNWDFTMAGLCLFVSDQI